MSIETQNRAERNKERPHAVPEIAPGGDEKVKTFCAESQDYMRSFTGDASIEVVPALPGMNTCCIDLDKGTIYIHADFVAEVGESQEKGLFAQCHEHEHFRELRELLVEKDGEQIWRRHRAKARASKRYHLMDNTWDDVRMNRGVVSRAPALERTKTDLYVEKLFPDPDFTKLPKHLQFSYALLRERMVDERCAVAPDVRAEIDRLESIQSGNIGLLDFASRPDIPPSMRIALQDKYIDPVSKRFFDEDVEQKQKEQQQKKEQSENGKGGEGEESETEPSQGEETENKGEGTPAKSEDYFNDEYAEYDAKNPDRMFPDEQLDEAVKKYIEDKKARAADKSEEEMNEEAYAREAGVTVDDLHTYQRFYAEVENIRNPETDERVIEELREIFRRIITQRMAPRTRPKLPADEGEILAYPAEAVAAIRAGIREPAVWETVETHERPRELTGDFWVRLVLDRSGSMDDPPDEDGAVKNIEQRKAAALILESLTEFSHELEDVRRDLAHDLHVRTEARSFGGDAEVGILKPLSETLTEKERVAVYKALGDTKGNATYDFKPLEQIRDSMSEEDWERIAAKRLRMIVIVISDGDSSSPSRVATAINGGEEEREEILDGKKVKKTAHVAGLRERGAIVVGVGVTKSGAAILTTYAPDGRVCEKAGRLGATLGELLKEYLTDL